MEENRWLETRDSLPEGSYERLLCVLQRVGDLKNGKIVPSPLRSFDGIWELKNGETWAFLKGDVISSTGDTGKLSSSYSNSTLSYTITWKKEAYTEIEWSANSQTFKILYVDGEGTEAQRKK